MKYLTDLGFKKSELGAGAYCYQTEIKTSFGKFYVSVQDDYIKRIERKTSEFEPLYIDVEVRNSDGKKTHLKNPKTGLVFVYSEALKKRGDLVPCDKDGNA